jgi:hypothetical protein
MECCLISQVQGQIYLYLLPGPDVLETQEISFLVTVIFIISYVREVARENSPTSPPSGVFILVIFVSIL